jgi:hypothetical protein
MSSIINETDIIKIEEIGHRIFYKNGNIYEGETIGFTPHGYGVLKYKNKIIYQGTWINGNRMLQVETKFNKNNQKEEDNNYEMNYNKMLEEKTYCDPGIILRC